MHILLFVARKGVKAHFIVPKVGIALCFANPHIIGLTIVIVATIVFHNVELQ